MQAYSISLLLICVRLCAQLFYAKKQAYTVANFINAHFLENILVHLEEILAIDIVLSKDLNVVGTLDADKVVADAILIPVLD